MNEKRRETFAEWFFDEHRLRLVELDNQILRGDPGFEDVQTRDVVAALVARGWPAHHVHLGSANWCVAVDEPNVPGTEWRIVAHDFGRFSAPENTRTHWGGALHATESGEVVAGHVIETGAPSSGNEEDDDRTADAIVSAITAWRAALPEDGRKNSDSDSTVSKQQGQGVLDFKDE